MKKRQHIRSGMILISFFMFPIVFFYLSPVLVLQASSEGTINGSLIVFLLLFLSSLFLGRAYCGWLCPAAGCQEALFKARNKKITRGHFLKWFIWVPWICCITLLAMKAGGYQKVDFFYQTVYGLSVSDVPSFITYNLVLFVLIVFPALLVGKRSFCHHLCWMAPFMILGRKVRNKFGLISLQLQSASDLCEHCHTCTDNCPMSLPVEKMVNQKMMENKECILCGTCVDGCKEGAISFDWGRAS